MVFEVYGKQLQSVPSFKYLGRTLTAGDNDWPAVGAFMAPACPGRRDHLGGGEPSSSNMPTMRHTGPVEFTKWTPQEYGDVQKWGGEEEAATGGGRGKTNRGDGLRGLREAATVGPQL